MKLDVLLGEVWLPIVGFEGLYEVSSRGRIKSLARKVPRRNHRRSHVISVRERILALDRTTGGYWNVKLCRDGGIRTFQAHRLVAGAFLGPPPTEHHEVHHKDFDPGNNRVENLQWVTRRENLDAKKGTKPVRLTCPCCSATLALQYRNRTERPRRATGLEVVA